MAHHTIGDAGGRCTPGRLLVTALVFCRAAHAQSFTGECADGASGMACRLLPALHFLYGLAGVLAVLLVAVLVVVVRAYRRKSAERELPR